FVVGALGSPEGKAVLTGVVSGGSVLGSAGGTGEIGDVEHAELDVDRGIEERSFGIGNLTLLGEAAGCFRESFHHACGGGVADGVGMRDRVGLKGGFLTNETRGKHGIEVVALGFAAKGALVGKRKKDFPDRSRNIGKSA